MKCCEAQELLLLGSRVCMPGLRRRRQAEFVSEPLAPAEEHVTAERQTHEKMEQDRKTDK